MGRRAEKEYYQPLADFLRKNGYITHTLLSNQKRDPLINIGQDRMLIDVFGIRRDFDHSLDTVGIEVKTKPKITVRALEQAAGYGKFCSHCYLAVPRKKNGKVRELSRAADFGVGVISYRRNPKRAAPKIELEARRNDINEAFVRRLLHKKNIFYCNICGTYNYRYARKKDERPFEGSFRKDIFLNDRVQVHLCQQCSEMFLYNDRVLKTEIAKLKASKNRTKQRLAKLKARMRRVR